MSPVSPPGGHDASDGDPLHDGADLALYTLGALDEIDLRRIETMLVTDGGAAAAEGRLRRIAGAVLAEAEGIDTAPPPSLRSRVLDAARAERPVAAVTSAPMPAASVHRIEGERLVELIRSLAPADWDRLVDPPELAGWTVRDLVVHLAAVESYFAGQLGLDPGVPETQQHNAARTAAAQERHRTLAPSTSVDELEQLLLRVADDVDRAGESIDRTIPWWGLEITVAQTLIVRSFELWTHANDIARATGRPEPTPPAPALRAMSTLAAGWIPLFLTVHGASLPADPHAWVRIDLTGPGGATHDIALDDATGSTTGPPTATVTLDVVEFCKAVGKRSPAGGVAFSHTGDDQVAAAVIASLPALATL